MKIQFIMNVFLSLLLLLLLLLLFSLYYKNKEYYKAYEKINSTLLPIYKLGNNKYITSAHYVDYENAIHLILYSDSNNIDFFKCIINNTNSNNTCYPKMQYESSIFYYRIELQTRKNEIPLYMKLNNVTIKFKMKKRIDSNSFVVCISVAVNLKRPLLMIEMIESYKKFGVSKIVVNYYSSTQSVIRVLNYYSKTGLIDIYQYNDTNDKQFREIEDDNEMFIYHFQMWKINHCFYEYKTPSNHIIVLDVDEILWIVKSSNYFELFDSLPKMDYYNLHQFFYKINTSIPDSHDRNATLPDIDIFSINSYCPTSNGIAHKYIIYNTNKVCKAEVHNIVYKENINHQYIPNNLAYVRHTRQTKGVLKNVCHDSSLVNYNKSSFEYKIQHISKVLYKKILYKEFANNIYK